MKKIISVFLCALMLFSVVPVSAFALTGDVFRVGAGVEFVDAWSGACLNNGTVVLDRNVNIANEYNLEDGYEIAIDLNGYTILGVGESADYLFNVCDGAKLIITDSSGDTDGGDVCEKCGTEHKDNFWGKIVCFFRRIVNFFRDLFN